MLAKILALRHGFKCTVLFAINPADGTIDPVTLTNLPGMAALDTADLCVVALRFRELPDEQMKHFVDYLEAGKPIIALRTSTHAFAYEHNLHSPYAKYDWRSQTWPGGFGQQVLGETWVSHHGNHGQESTRGVINRAFRSDPLLRGVTNIWGPTDVYTVEHLAFARDAQAAVPPDLARVLVWGQVLSGMHSNDPPVAGPKNEPLMPLAWQREYRGAHGKLTPVFVTTMGAAVDLENEDLRRLLVNACYAAVGLPAELLPVSNVDYVGEYKPTWFGFGKFKRGLKPDDLRLAP